MQIKLLKLLALLGSGDKPASEHMYTVIGDIIRKGDSSSNIGNAILYESIRCISSIYPNPKLLEAAADVIAKFLKVFFLLKQILFLVYVVHVFFFCDMLHLCCGCVCMARVIVII